MKIKLILFLIILHNFAFGYKLLNSWLATPDNHTVYLTHEVDSLASSWGLDFQACINAVNSHGVTNVPTLIAASTTSEVADCIVKYERLHDGSVAICSRDDFGEYFSFTIIINDSMFIPSQHKINTIITHELTHSLGLDDISDNTALMYELNNGYNANITNLTNDEKNGLKNVYEKPVIKNITSSYYQYNVASGDSIILAYKDTLIIDMKGPDFLVHNSIKPPSVRTESFMNSVNPTDTLEYTVIDTNLYRYRIPADDLETESINLFRSFLKRNSMNHDLSNYFSENSPLSKLYIDVKPIPEVIYPNPDDIYPIKKPGKAIVTDTLEIKIKVPKVSGSYPAIKIKIDGVYVSQSEIFLDDTVYVYPWDLSTVTSDPDGKRFKIEAELFDDPNCSSASSVFTVEAAFLEHFQEITDLQTEGWTIYSYEWPLQTYIGWMLGPDPTYIANEKCARTYSTYSTSFTYQLTTPAFTVPDCSERNTKLEYRLYYKKMNSPNSYIYFDVCDEGGAPLGTTQMLGPMYGTWTDMNYDLSAYSNQTIKLRWNHSYTNGIQSCNSTSYALDNIAVYRIPDTDSPSIDFVYGNQANVNQDMNIQLTFNDDSDIESVTADYVIEDDSDTITLTLGKNSYNYTGTIPARDHECNGGVVFTVKDVIGNEIVTDVYDIYWTDTTQPPTSPGNLEMITENDSTITISWEMVPGASEYKVYTSEDPYGTFTIDSTGTFIASTQWQKNTNANRKFYYVVASNTSKKKEKVEKKEDIETEDKIEKKKDMLDKEKK